MMRQKDPRKPKKWCLRVLSSDTPGEASLDLSTQTGAPYDASHSVQFDVDANALPEHLESVVGALCLIEPEGERLTELKRAVRAGEVEFEDYLLAIRHSVHKTSDSESPLDGHGTLPAFAFVIDSRARLPDGSRSTDKWDANERTLAALRLKRCLTKSSNERQALDSLFGDGHDQRNRPKLSIEDPRKQRQIARQPFLYRPSKVWVSLGSSPHDETSHQGNLKVFLSIINESDVRYEQIALVVLVGKMDVLCNLVAGDQKTIGGLYAIRELQGGSEKQDMAPHGGGSHSRASFK